MPKPLGLLDLAGRSVVIVGLGREGRAIAKRLTKSPVAQALVALEGRDGPGVGQWSEEFGDRVPVVVWEGEGGLPDALAGCEVAVMSPGVAATSGLYRALESAGLILTSSSALFAADHRDHLVGVTGSKGKSTTTTLVHHLLERAGLDVGLGGNMGIPVQGIADAASYVVEFSSYQCHYLQASPDVVVFTALFPEHLDWHGSLDRYYGDKLALAGFSPRVVIANSDDPTLREELTRRYPALAIEWVGQGHAWHLEDDGPHAWLVHGQTRLAHSTQTGLLGRHNHHNALIALAAAAAASGIEADVLAAGFEGFAPLPHRLEPIADPSGVVFVNDSLATNPQAAAAALRALAQSPVVLLVGGMDRGVDYQPLMAQIVHTPPIALLGLPESGPRLVELARTALHAAGAEGGVQLEAVDSMEQAVRRGRELSKAGGYVVLSPAAPSFGRYRDFAHRAEDFRYWIENTKGER